MSKQVRINDNLIVHKDFFDFLANTGGLVTALILNLETLPEVNFISPTDRVDMVSYLPMNKFKEQSDFDPFDNSSRTTLKVGRLVNKLIPEKVSSRHGLNDSGIELFVNSYKSWFDQSNIELKIVEGEEIRKWYLEDNYLRPNGSTIGTLWNSCMRYKDRQKFLDMYCVNPDVKMLIMLSNIDGKQKLRCRALLWDKVEVLKANGDIPKEIKVMDRIYSIFDSDVYIMKRWAEENGYIPKWEQNSKSHQIFDIKGEAQIINSKILLDKFKLRSYPYLDTFPYFNDETGELYNTEFNPNWIYKLVQADGSLERVREEDHDNDDWDD